MLAISHGIHSSGDKLAPKLPGYPASGNANGKLSLGTIGLFDANKLNLDRLF